MSGDGRSRALVAGMVVAAAALLVPIFQLPIWWVSLEAPNYPKEAFPDGVRINFHLNGVFSGCAAGTDGDATGTLDCVHEMDTINHYVGMYPIAAGGPIEVAFSLFVLALLGFMLVAFLLQKPLLRVVVLGGGVVAVGAWMGAVWYGDGGLRYQSEGYLEGRVMAFGAGVEEEDTPTMTPGEAIIARLKASLEESGVDTGAPDEPVDETLAKGKAASIEQLRASFEADRNVAAAGREWSGSGRELLSWHFRKTLGRYFNDPARIDPMVARMARAADTTFWSILGVAALLAALSRRTNGVFHWLLLLVPATLPLLFVVEYASWLWWYGHNMSDMGAFTLKPFMPTVFGQGKVAQFTTSSYPHVGFWLMLAFTLLLLGAAFVRRRALQEAEAA